MYSQGLKTFKIPETRRIAELSARVLSSIFGLEPKSKPALVADRPRIFFSNHTSHLDFILLWSSLPSEVRKNTVAAAASDYWCKTALRRWIAVQLFSTIIIERKDISRDNNPVTAVVEQLDRGRSVIIFPEGGRTDGPEVCELKGGLYHIARKRPDVEMVPAFIHNANRVLPKGVHIPVPLICSVSFGQPIKLTPGENKLEFVARARSELEKCRVA